jgi:hypothetical protein
LEVHHRRPGGPRGRLNARQAVSAQAPSAKRSPATTRRVTHTPTEPTQ